MDEIIYDRDLIAYRTHYRDDKRMREAQMLALKVLLIVIGAVIGLQVAYDMVHTPIYPGSSNQVANYYQ